MGEAERNGSKASAACGERRPGGIGASDTRQRRRQQPGQWYRQLFAASAAEQSAR